MKRHALEDIDQVGVGVDALQPAGGQQALYDADVLGADLAPTEHPVFLTHGNAAQATLQVVGVDRHVGIGQKYLQAPLSLQRVLHGLAQRVRGSRSSRWSW